MSERTVYERVECRDNVHDPAHIRDKSRVWWNEACFVPIDCKEKLVQTSGDVETIRRLQGLLRQAQPSLLTHRNQLYDEGNEHLSGLVGETCDAIDAELDGECKHDGGWMTEVEFWNLEVTPGGEIRRIWHPKDSDCGVEHTEDSAVFCRLCGAPASEVK